MDRESLIKSLLWQQFWRPPDQLTDRTKSLNISVPGSDGIMEELADIFHQGCKSCSGCQEGEARCDTPELLIEVVTSRLCLNSSLALQLFREKMQYIMGIELEPSNVLMFAISSVLEYIKIFSANSLIKEVMKYLEDKQQPIAREQVERILGSLSEKADSEYNLLLNMETLKVYTNCLMSDLKIPSRDEFMERIIYKIVANK
ncbi:MAG: hypothetical protein ACFFC7_24030 [Candidatus Hermodarchaeota archaeon]